MPDLYDASGNLIPAAALQRPPLDNARMAGIRDRFSNYPTAGLTPATLAEILEEMDQGELRRGMEMWEEMEEKDTHLGADLQQRKMALIAKGWEVLPPKGNDSPQAKAIADAAAAMLDAIPNLTEALQDLLDYLKGLALLQIHWAVNGRSARVARLEWTHPKFLTYQNSMVPKLVTDSAPMGIELQPFKWILHKHKARSGFDTRLGLGRSIAWLYLLTNYAIKDWSGFLELFGQPWRIGKYPAGAPDGDKNALIDALSSMGSDFACAISEAMSVELIQAGNASGTKDLFDGFLGRMEKRITLAVLGQQLTSEAGGLNGQGSRSLGDTHSGILDNLIAADGRALDETLTAQLLTPWTAFNYGANAPVPRFHCMTTPAEDLNATADLYNKAINQLGMDISQEHLSETLKIPLRQSGETAVIRAAANPFLGGAGGGNDFPRAPSALKDLAGGAALAEAGAPLALVDEPPIVKMEKTKADLMNWTSRNVGPALNAKLKPLRDLIANAASLEDIQAALKDFDLDNSDLTEAQAQSFALAKLAGRSDAQRHPKGKK